MPHSIPYICKVLTFNIFWEGLNFEIINIMGVGVRAHARARVCARVCMCVALL